MIQLPTLTCPNCAASVPFSADSCTYCQTHIATPTRIEERQKAAALYVTAINEAFSRDGWLINVIAASAFTLPIITIILTRYWERSWLLAGALGFISFVILISVLDTVTNHVHVQKFDTEVKPQLLRFVDKTGWSLNGLLATISDELPEDALLRKFIGRL